MVIVTTIGHPTAILSSHNGFPWFYELLAAIQSVLGPAPLCFVFVSRNRQASPGAALWPRVVPAGRGALGRGLPARSGTKRPSPWEQKAPLAGASNI